MMTFEEFFAKKKIDLKQLLAARPGLVEEFQEHYTLMGEKSFDHTKKYWFNRLRKDFRLAEAETPTARPAGTAAATPQQKTADAADESQLPTAEIPKVDTPAGPSTPRAPGFKPRFKPGLAGAAKTESKADEAVPVTSVPEASDTPPAATAASSADEPKPATAKPVGFKPRFKPGVTGAVKTESKADDVVPTASVPEASDTPPAATGASPADEPKPATAKPVGFKPRFKPGVTGAVKTESKADDVVPAASVPEVSDTPPAATAAIPSTETPETTPQAETSEASAPPAASKPTGFKPRFKPGVSGAVKTESKADDVVPTESKTDEAVPAASVPEASDTPPAATAAIPSTETPETTPQAERSETPAPPAASKPTGFKPRFKPGVTGVKKDNPEE